MSQTALRPSQPIHLTPPPPIQPAHPQPTNSAPPPPSPSPTPLIFPTRPSHPIHPQNHIPDIAPTDFPASFLHEGWSAFWPFAAEFVGGMHGLLMQWLEGTGKYGWVRRTT